LGLQVNQNPAFHPRFNICCDPQHPTPHTPHPTPKNRFKLIVTPSGCEPSTITIKLEASGRWFASLLVDTDITQLPKSDKQIGLDVGITSLIATSNGDKITNPKHFKQLRKKLKRVQKALSRKQKGSNNRNKGR
jgi:transposase